MTIANRLNVVCALFILEAFSYVIAMAVAWSSR